MSTKKKPQPQQAAPKGAGPINIDSIADKLRSLVDKNLQGIFDKSVIAGMRIMFDKSSHAMALAELEKPGPMPKKLAEGAIQLVYLLWDQSNKSLPPKILVPLGQMFVLRAFQFLQLSQDPEATKETLGEAYAEVTQGILDRAGATPDKIPALLKGQGGQPQPKQAGMLAAGGK